MKLGYKHIIVTLLFILAVCGLLLNAAEKTAMQMTVLKQRAESATQAIERVKKDPASEYWWALLEGGKAGEEGTTKVEALKGVSGFYFSAVQKYKTFRQSLDNIVSQGPASPAGEAFNEAYFNATLEQI